MKLTMKLEHNGHKAVRVLDNTQNHTLVLARNEMVAECERTTLGTILFHMLNGHVPISTPSNYELAAKEFIDAVKKRGEL